mgnify:FL=1
MRLHFIAIGGSAMHNLALAMHKAGHSISGSDDEIFEPSHSRLKAEGLLPPEAGWFPEKITAELDQVILGMHARPDNPELKKAHELGLPVLSYPEFLYQRSSEKTRVVIAGSHGKTTITAMILHILHFHNEEADFMVGAQLKGFDTMVRTGSKSEFMLLEGDEYLSSPEDHRPKFLHYHPNIALLSGIAWDHINVFPNFESYRAQFTKFVDSIEPGGALVYNAEDPLAQEVVNHSKNEIKRFPYTLPDYEVREGQYYLNTDEGEIPLLIKGRHNMNNLEGARWICNQMGITNEQFYEAIGSFEGASLRMEPLREDEQLKVYRDYAHAPSKVKASLEALREAYPHFEIIGCLELHTFSSLNSSFIPHYRESMQAADRALVYFNPKVLAHKRLPPLEPAMIQEAFQHPHLTVVTTKDELLAKLPKAKGPAAYLLMSSGNFDGINWRDYWLS